MSTWVVFVECKLENGHLESQLGFRVFATYLFQKAYKCLDVVLASHCCIETILSSYSSFDLFEYVLQIALICTNVYLMMLTFDHTTMNMVFALKDHYMSMFYRGMRHVYLGGFR